MKAEKDEILANWLKRKENVYTSSTIQNEMIKLIKLMCLSMLRNTVAELQKAPFLAIMADEPLIPPIGSRSPCFCGG